jgi:transcription elongation factor Elf1
VGIGWGDGEALRLEEIEALSSRFSVCPKCNSSEGVWLGMKRDQAYVQCKSCGASFELFEVLPLAESRKPPLKLRLLRR